jgi:hypothetical protein
MKKNKRIRKYLISIPEIACIKDAVANSLNSEACKKYEGILTDKAERIQ